MKGANALAVNHPPVWPLNETSRHGVKVHKPC